MSGAYRVTVKVRNAHLLRAIEQAGYAPGAKLAEAAGISYSKLNDLVTMRSAPVDRNGNLTPTTEKLCALLGKMPCELFDHDQMYGTLESNSGEFEASLEELGQFGLAAPLHVQLAIDSALDTLPERYAQVLRLRFGIESEPLTLDETSHVLDVTPERIRQIEQKALRMLRHPRTSRELAEVCV